MVGRYAVTLTVGGVHFCLTPDLRPSKECQSQEDSTKSNKFSVEEERDGNDALSGVVAVLSNFSGTLRVRLPTELQRKNSSSSTAVPNVKNVESSESLNKIPRSPESQLDMIMEYNKAVSEKDLSRDKNLSSSTPPVATELATSDWVQNEIGHDSFHLYDESFHFNEPIQLTTTTASISDRDELPLPPRPVLTRGIVPIDLAAMDDSHVFPNSRPVEKADAFQNFSYDVNDGKSGGGSCESLSINIFEPEPATPLHEACGNPDISVVELRAILEEDPKAASVVDDEQNLPMHILSRNSDLLKRRHRRGRGGDDIEFFFRDLLDVYPAAILTEDAQGHLPFTDVVQDWITNVYHEEYRRILAEISSSNTRVVRRKSNLNPFWSSDRSMTRGSQQNSKSRREINFIQAAFMGNPDFDNDKIERLFPTNVFVTPVAERSLVLLSSALDRFSRPISRSGGTRRDQLAARDKIARAVASVPYFLKTILLIEDDDTRTRIMDLPVVRRALLCKETVGPSLVHMLKYHGQPSQRVVDYFVLVSSIGVVDFVGKSRSARIADVVDFHDEQDNLFESVEQYTPQIIPSLVSLSRNEIEKVSTTKFVWRILNSTISRPFVIGIVMIDLVLHVTMMMAFRIKVADNGHTLNNPTYVDNTEGSFSFRQDQISDILIYSIGTHYLLREISAGVSLGMVSKKVLFSYFFDFWNMIDVLAIMFTIISTSIMSSTNKSNMSIFLTATMGLLWLTLIGFLKAVNMHLATFILAVFQIIKDIKWFLIVLVTGIFMFADMVHITTTHYNDGILCSDDAEVAEGSAIADFCSRDLVFSYVRMYSVLIGDFNYNDYKSTAPIVVLFIIFTLIGVIVLLNVLIAIVSDSYERSRLRSAHLFGRARVGFAAEHVSLETFLRPTGNDRKRPKFNSFEEIVWILGNVARWGVLISILGTAILVDVFLLDGIVITATSSAVEKDYAGFFKLILCVILNVAIIVVFEVLFKGCKCHIGRKRSTDSNGERQSHPLCGKDGHCKNVKKAIRFFIEWTIRFVSQRVFGITHLGDGFGSHDCEEEEWGGRLEYITEQTSLIVTEAEQRVSNLVRETEERLRDHDASSTNEMKKDFGKLMQNLFSAKTRK